jgi:hypothetical protein
MNRRAFLDVLTKAAAGFAILPAATTYARTWAGVLVPAGANESGITITAVYEGRERDVVDVIFVGEPEAWKLKVGQLWDTPLGKRVLDSLRNPKTIRWISDPWDPF